MPTMCSSVDFPAPDGPIIDTNSPGAISRSIRRSTYVRVGPWGNDFSTPRKLIIEWLQNRSQLIRAWLPEFRAGLLLLLLRRSGRRTGARCDPHVGRSAGRA